MNVRKTMRELLFNKKNFRNLALCSFLWFATILQYEITLNYSYSTPLSYYDDSYVHSLVELTGYVFSLFVFLKLKKKGRIFMVANLFSVIGGIVLIITDA
jgi:hypothetical protein